MYFQLFYLAFYSTVLTHSRKDQIMKMNKKVLAIGTTLVILCSSLPNNIYANSEVPVNEKTSGFAEIFLQNENLTEDQIKVLNDMPALEDKYLEKGLNLPVDPYFKRETYSPIGGWDWRDGLICVTDHGKGNQLINTWHCGIVAPQAVEVVAEAANPEIGCHLRSGVWVEPNHTVWQVGVNSTSVEQDWKAGEWGGEQCRVRKPYNTNFWNARQTDSFYCSQLVWASYYYVNGVDLNKPDNDLGSNIAIHPGEFVENPNTTIVYRNR